MIFQQWDFTNGLCKIATNLPVPFLRDYCYAALAKVTELLELKVDFTNKKFHNIFET